ncbi:MAG: peptidylprolyl isomerase [Bacteroidota bacterium]
MMVRTIVAGFIVVMLGGTQQLHAQVLIDKVAAVVDKEIITESDVAERLAMIAMQNRLDAADPELKKQVLESMVSEKLILAQAILDSVTVTEEEVTRTLEQQFQNIIRQAGSEQRVEELYGKPVSRLKREYRPEMKKQLLIQRIRQQREASMLVSRREVEEFYEAYKDSLPSVPEELELSHIFLKPKPDTTQEETTRRTLTVIRDSIVAGGDFADFARRYSQDGSAAGGGDLGWAKRGVVFVPEFEEAVFSLKEKEVSKVFKTDFGYHIVQLIERRGETVNSRHILLRIQQGPESDSAAVEQLRLLRGRALKGESFAELARKYSEDEETKSIGGDLGRVAVDQLEEAFAGVVKNLKEGEITEPHRVPVRASYGYQIISVRRRVAAHAMNLQDDYKRVEQMALFVKRNRLNTEWVEELKRSIYWEIRL